MVAHRTKNGGKGEVSGVGEDRQDLGERSSHCSCNQLINNYCSLFVLFIYFKVIILLFNCQIVNVNLYFQETLLITKLLFVMLNWWVSPCYDIGKGVINFVKFTWKFTSGNAD